MADGPELIAETRAWLLKGANDLAAATHDLQAHPPLTEDVVFHAQQAAEKTLKAFLTWHTRPFRKSGGDRGAMPEPGSHAQGPDRSSDSAD